MLNRKWLDRGRHVAIGVFLYAAVVIPLVSDQRFGVGFLRAIFAAGAVFVIYVVIAAIMKEQRED